MEYLVFGLIGVPILAAIVMLFLKEKQGLFRKIFVYLFALAIAVCSIVLVVNNIGASFVDVQIPGDEETVKNITQIISYVFTGVGAICALVVLWFGFKYKNFIAMTLSVIQLAASIVFEFGFAPKCETEVNLYYDCLSLIMVFIIGVIGSGICVYALGYMKDFAKHLKEGEKDRSNRFFALMFVFLSAMFVIVLSNNMTWMFAGWEVTTLCSFLLIGYTKTDEAIKNSFRQINMNLLGGIAFVAAMFFCVIQLNTLSLAEFISLGYTKAAVVALPCALLAFAGITKAAQMPFHTWLLGAMVAPTPTSALLHSSTMVKAGVFMLIKLSPVFCSCIAPRIMVMLVGGITFLLCSCMAISQSNAKRVLAYSTIANLGLITACAGVGTPEAIWAATFLVIFHAAAKSLLFLCVGTAEHHIGSRNIEDMDALFTRMPKLARLMMVGIMAMFVAPFGMLVSKWAALVSFVDSNQIVLIMILAFGSAVTFMFWAKWLGKLAGIVSSQNNVEKTIHKSEWISLMLMTVLVFSFVILLPAISDMFVMPYIQVSYMLAFGQYGSYMLQSAINFISVDSQFICIICAVVMAFVLFVGANNKTKKKQNNIYLAGVSVDNDKRVFEGSMGNSVVATVRNMYLDNLFGEAKLSPIGSILNIVVFAMALIVCVLLMFGITL